MGGGGSPKPKKLVISVANTRYDSIKDVAKKKLKWRLSMKEEPDDFDLYWNDLGVLP